MSAHKYIFTSQEKQNTKVTTVPNTVTMKIVLFLTSITTAVAAKCGSSVSISGSDVIAPIALVWKAGYAHQCPSAKVTVATGGSTKGLAAVCAGTVDIGASSRVPKSTEATKGSNGSYTCVTGGKKLTEVSIALDGLTISAKPGGAAASCIKALVSICE